MHVSGDEDRSTSGRRRRAFSAALQGEQDIVVDLSELHFADISLMIDLAILARRLRARGAMLWLRHPQPQIGRLIEHVGLDRLPSVSVIDADPIAA